MLCFSGIYTSSYICQEADHQAAKCVLAVPQNLPALPQAWSGGLPLGLINQSHPAWVRGLSSGFGPPAPSQVLATLEEGDEAGYPGEDLPLMEQGHCGFPGVCKFRHICVTVPIAGEVTVHVTAWRSRRTPTIQGSSQPCSPQWMLLAIGPPHSKRPRRCQS